MGLDPVSGGDSHKWNYSKPDQPGYSTKLTGTVLRMQQVQALNFSNNGQPGTPKFWDNNPTQPVWNIRMVLVGPSGGYRTWTFTPASKAAKAGEKYSVHVELFKLAGGKSMEDLYGKTITIETDEPPAGFGYGQGKPRPWRVSLAPEGVGPYELKEALDPVLLMDQVLANGAVSGGVINSPMGSAAAPYPAAAPAPAGVPAPASAPAPAADPLGGGDDIPF